MTTAPALDTFHGTALGAPRDLRERALRAARDERQHAHAMTDLARERGAVVPRVRAARRRARSLFDVALENATEGCVRESYGALFAVWQAEHAFDPRVRVEMQNIARDEAEHAELASDVHEWARKRLAPHERASLDRAMDDAWLDLEREVELSRPSAPLTRELGVPPTNVAVVLVKNLRAALA